MSLLTSFLGILEEALTNPENKAAVKLARDGLVMWQEIAAIPSVLQFEADIGAYEKLVAARTPAVPAPLDPPAPEVQDGARGGARGGLMAPGT